MACIRWSWNTYTNTANTAKDDAKHTMLCRIHWECFNLPFILSIHHLVCVSTWKSRVPRWISESYDLSNSLSAVWFSLCVWAYVIHGASCTFDHNLRKDTLMHIFKLFLKCLTYMYNYLNSNIVYLYIYGTYV